MEGKYCVEISRNRKRLFGANLCNSGWELECVCCKYCYETPWSVDKLL